MSFSMVLREKSSRSGRIYFAAPRDEKNRRFVSYGSKEEKK
jgi:hypothetical protein